MTTAIEPRKHTVEARGLRFHYVEWGAPDAPPIVLLHGLSAMCRIWDHLAGALHDRYRLIELDQRGHGETSWPAEPEYSTDDYVGDLEAMVDAWGLERFILIGLSMGGMNAMAYAARHPERVTRLVAVDIRPAFNVEKRPTAKLEQLVAENGHPTFEDLEAAFIGRQMSNPNTPGESIRHHVRHLYKQRPDGQWVAKHDPRVSHHWRPRNRWDELPKVEAPVLIVRGGRSQVLPEEQAAKMRAAFANAELVTIEESGHTVPEDAPQRFNEAVEAFLAR